MTVVPKVGQHFQANMLFTDFEIALFLITWSKLRGEDMFWDTTHILLEEYRREGTMSTTNSRNHKAGFVKKLMAIMQFDAEQPSTQ